MPLTMPSISASLLGIGVVLRRLARPLVFLDRALLGFLRRDQLSAHLHRSRQPEQRVRAAYGERPHQQSGHAPEGPEEEWELLRIVMRGVRQISGEAPGSTLVTFLAGGHDVGARQVRARIADLLNVVGTVTVVALGSLGVA